MQSAVGSCLINQTTCGRVAGNPVCPKCGMDERVVYPGQADREAAQARAELRYLRTQVTELEGRPPPPKPPGIPDSLIPKGIYLFGVGVLVLALLGGGWWLKDLQDQRVKQAQEQAAQQALAAEQVRVEREAEKQRADDAERVARLAREQKDSQTVLAPSQPNEKATAFLHGRYQILADGSEVKDVQTGLVWARCSVGQRWDGSTCASQAREFTFEQAKKLVGNGWLVPTATDLASLIYCSSGQTRDSTYLEDGGKSIPSWCDGNFNRPTIRAGAFPNTNGLFWSSSPVDGAPQVAWSVDFDDGYINYGSGRETKFHVRLMRASR